MLALLLLGIPALAQGSGQDAGRKTVTGRVLDESGQPVIGAGIMVQGTTQGVATDLDGNFTISVPSNGTLVIQSIGYKTVSIPVNGRNRINATLASDQEMLEETVVVGYGTQKKESVVASIAQVGSESLRKVGNSSDLTEALIGQAPGLVSLTASGEPGGITTGESATSLFIRGKNTWNGGGPLILVDGVERNMNNVDVNEVERISVLKDASATAVFGVKGANGVILITTKRGEEGKTRLNFNYTVTGKMIAKQPEKMDSYEAMMAKNDVIEREGVLNEVSWAAYVPYRIIERFRTQGPTAWDLQHYPDVDWDSEAYSFREIYPNVDWTKEMYDDFAVNTHKVSANIQGGSKKIKYFGSLAYMHEGDMFRNYDNGKPYDPNYDFDRFNFRSNVDFDLTKTTRLKFDLAGFFSRKNTNFNNESSTSRADQWMYSAAYFLAPNMFLPMYSDGRWGAYSDGANSSTNPLAAVYNLGLRQTRTTQINARFALDQDLSFITKGLKASLQVTYDNTIRSEGGVYDINNSIRASEARTNVAYRYINYKNYFPGADPGAYALEMPVPEDEYDWAYQVVSRRYETILAANWANYIPVTRRLTYQAQLNYARDFGKHGVTAMGVFKREEYAQGSMFPNYREDWVGRFTYDYDSRYLLEANGAYNGSEKFGPGYRFEFFPSVALGWYISNEPWFKMSWLNKLKLRYSLGKVGDDTGGSRWAYVTSYAYGGRSRLAKGTTAYSPYYMYRESTLGNPDLHWETATKQNFGLEVGAWKDLITFSFDYFTEKRTDIIRSGSSRSIPAFFGATAPAANLGRVNARGFEIELGVNKQIGKDLLLWGKLTANHNENTVMFADDPQLQFFYLKAQGYQINQQKTQLSAGMYRSWDDIYASVPQESNDGQKLPGYFNIVDFNADGIIKSSEDTPPVGYSEIPQNTGSLALGAEWKGWNFMIQFYAVNNANRVINWNNYTSDYDIVYKNVSDYWSKENPNGTAFLPRWQTNGEFIGSYYYYDASFVRLQLIELGYTFKKVGLLKKIHCDNLRLFVNGNDLFFWSDLPDARTTTYTGGNATQGAYPTLKRINFGVDLSF
ncbi:MAG: TonB-dependent receptor [Bacteroidales bacterium]|nr:TonB-dependent receptor [Bacteroidales bacterium]